MLTSFDLGGFIIDVASGDSGLTSKDGKAGTSTHKSVGIQVTSVSLDRQTQTTLMQVTLKPSEARAIASVLLSAATQAGNGTL